MSRFQLSLQGDNLAGYVARQLNLMFPDEETVSSDEIQTVLPKCLERLEYCFSHIRRKYYFDGNEVFFNHRHADHYAAFLYLLAHTSYEHSGESHLCEKLFLLNKALHALDLFYSVKLPDVFLFIHPVGTVLGNATYGNYLLVYQNVSVGSTEDGSYPVLGEGIVLFSKSAVIGGCSIGNNVIFGADSFVLNTYIQECHTVVGHYPHLKIKPHKDTVQKRFFELL